MGFNIGDSHRAVCLVLPATSATTAAGSGARPTCVIGHMHWSALRTDPHDFHFLRSREAMLRGAVAHRACSYAAAICSAPAVPSPWIVGAERASMPRPARQLKPAPDCRSRRGNGRLPGHLLNWLQWIAGPSGECWRRFFAAFRQIGVTSIQQVLLGAFIRSRGSAVFERSIRQRAILALGFDRRAQTSLAAVRAKLREARSSRGRTETLTLSAEREANGDLRGAQAFNQSR